MNILQVNDNDLFGNRFNGFMLNEVLRSRGHTAEQVVWTKHSDSPHVHLLGGSDPRRLHTKAAIDELHTRYSTHAAFYPHSYDLLFQPAYLNADVVNLHLVHNLFLNIFHLPIVSRLKPTVWTLHDPWAMTGHCVHPFGCDQWLTGCGSCPLPQVVFPIEHDTTALNFEIKRMIYDQCDLDLVVASDWMLERVRRAPLLAGFPVHKVPFGVDHELFYPGDTQAAKEAHGIDPDTIVVALRAIPGEFKGLDIIEAALDMLETDRPVTILTFNATNLLDRFKRRFKIVELGWVHGDQAMANAYRAIDLLVMPSAAESFGMMAMEAMASGVPPIVTDGTALPETIMPDQGGGVVVPRSEPAKLAGALKHLIEHNDERRQMSDRAREIATKHYSVQGYVDGMLAVYESAIKRRRSADDPRPDRIIAELQPVSAAHYPLPQLDNAAAHPAAIESTPQPANGPPPRPASLPSPPAADPNSLALLIKVHSRLSQSRVLKRLWHRVLKPLVRAAQKLAARRQKS